MGNPLGGMRPPLASGPRALISVEVDSAGSIAAAAILSAPYAKYGRVAYERTNLCAKTYGIS